MLRMKGVRPVDLTAVPRQPRMHLRVHSQSGRLASFLPLPPHSSTFVGSWSCTMNARVRRVALIFCVLAVMAGQTTCRAEEARPPAGFRALFNGKDLSGWYGLNPHNLTGLDQTNIRFRKISPKLKATIANQVKHYFASTRNVAYVHTAF